MTRLDIEIQKERDDDSKHGYYEVNGCYKDDDDDTDEYDGMMSCMECNSLYDPDEIPVITYKSNGFYMTICTDCFFRMIGWEEAIKIPWGGSPEDAEAAIDYENALYIMRNVVGKTGHTILDKHRQEMIAMLERIVELTEQTESAKCQLHEIKKGA